MALRAHRREAWDRIAWQLYWIVNTQPNFGSRPRYGRPLWQFNPLSRRPRPSQLEKDAAFAAVWDIVEDG